MTKRTYDTELSALIPTLPTVRDFSSVVGNAGQQSAQLQQGAT